MATIYRAFANGEEITGFPINGVETKEIWGGDTLLWKKQGAIKFPDYFIDGILHCGKRALVALRGGNPFFILCTPKSTAPYYDVIFSSKYYDNHIRYGFLAIFNEELYVLEYVSTSSTAKNKYAYKLLDFYIYANDMTLKKHFSTDFDIEIEQSGDDRIAPFKMWAENNRFHLVFSHYISDDPFPSKYLPSSLETFVFEDGKLVEHQQDSSLSCNYRSDSTHLLYPCTTTVSSTAHNGNYYYIATEGVQYGSDSRLTEVNAKSPIFKVLSGSQGNYDSYFAGCHNGKNLWKRKGIIYESIENNFTQKCTDLDSCAGGGFVPYGTQYLGLGGTLENSHYYPTVRTSKNNAFNKNDIVFKASENTVGTNWGIITEKDLAYVFYDVSASNSRMEFFKI